MKSKHLSLILGLGCGMTAVAVANPLQRGDVTAEPGWVAHVDCDALRSAVVGQFLLSELEKPSAQGKLGAFQAMFGVDLRKQVHGLTLYGPSATPEDGVLLVYADFDSDRLVTLAKGANGYRSTNHNQHVIHNWLDDHRRGKDGVKARTYAAIHGGRVIVFGQREATVGAALDVLDRTSPNLAGTRAFGQLGAGSATGIIQAAARKMNVPGGDPGAALFRLSQLAQLQVGETDQKLTATLNLEANDEEVARQMTSIGQGLVALLKLQSARPEGQKLAEAISMKQEGAGVVATMAMPANDFIDLVKTAAAHKARKHSEEQ